MNGSEPRLVYVILGAAGSGRRQVLSDLVDGGIAEDERSVVLLSANEADADVKLGRTATWNFEDGRINISAEALGDATHVFFVTDGRSNPVDQIEAFKAWLDTSGSELARILTVVNCQLAERHQELVAWYEACIHFSDVVLLARREGVANKWLSDFQNRFKDQFFPCLFEFVKDGRVKNPPLVLEPQARRVSHLFDEPDWEIIGDDLEEGVEEGDETKDEEVEVAPEVDPYLERRIGGRRVKEIPDIAKFVGEGVPSSAQKSPGGASQG
jgi:hypothetical protein